MNMFSYYITTHFITSNKDYNSCRNSHSVYQMYPYCRGQNLSLYTGLKVSFFNNNASEEKKAWENAP